MAEFTAEHKAIMESYYNEDFEEGSRMEDSGIVDEPSAYERGMESTYETLTKAVNYVAEGSYVAMETSFETKECVLCRRKKDDKNSSLCWIALVQRYNLPCQVLNRGTAVANISDVGPVPIFDEFCEGNVSDEDLDQLVIVGFPVDTGVATAIDFSTVGHVQSCGHQPGTICIFEYKNIKLCAPSFTYQMHFNCFQGHMKNLQLSRNGDDGVADSPKAEFSCPTCLRLANVLLPDVVASLSSKKHDMPEDGKDVKETGKFWSRFWQSNKNLESAVDYYCSQVLRVQTQLPLSFFNLRRFELSQALWEGLVSNIVHCEVETRDGHVKAKTASSSSAPNKFSDECTWGGDSGHWIALLELGRLAMLSNTLPDAVQGKDKMLRRLKKCLGLLGRSETGSESPPNWLGSVSLRDLFRRFFPKTHLIL